MKRTALYNKHIESNGKMVEFAGYELPIQYSSLTEEHNTVRSKAGLFDVSHMGEFKIVGEGAFDFIQNLITNDLNKITDNQVIYTPMCYEDGNVVDDLLVYRFSSNEFLLVVNASNIDKDFDWVISNSKGYSVNITNESDNYSQLAVQGPLSEVILDKVCKTNLKDLAFFNFRDDIELFDNKAIISRTGYTGEDGFEIYISNEAATKLWDLILEVGKDYGLLPIGLGARDTLRFEACLPLYGNEISESINPLEAGLGMFVKLDTDFSGKEVLKANKESGLKRKLVGIELSKGIAREGYEISLDDKIIGKVTTGYKSPTLNKSIALVLIQSEYANLGDIIDIHVRKKMFKAEIISKRFYKKNYKI